MTATAISPIGRTVEVTATVFDHPTQYGNGKAMSFAINGNSWKVVDCRYLPDFEPFKVFEQVLKDNFDGYTIH